jgi:hypothetical protein
MTERVMMVAEEVRVNAFAKAKGYDIDLLQDGSEKTSGVQSAKRAMEGDVEAKNEMFAFGAGLVGGKAFRAFINGVRSVNKEYAQELRKMELAILKEIRHASVGLLGATNLVSTKGDVSVPEGFNHYVPKIALHIMATQEFVDNNGISEDVVGVGGGDYETGNALGKFAPLIIDRKFLCDQQVKGHLARKKRASSMGTNLVYPERLLTDPDRRVFAQKAKASGGIVLIDVSGSMEITDTDIEQILALSPGALVMAYSHKPKSLGIPNLWILANRGKRCSAQALKTIGNIGNGVDGPALEYAVKRRIGREPIIWVCDGQVTDSHDKPAPNLTEECAKIVKKNGIIVIPDMESAVKALRIGRNAESVIRGRLASAMQKVR